jgi:hypothetical protein
VAGQLGYCGLDRRRQPLTGEEIRGCWEGWPAASLRDAADPLTIAPARPVDGDRQPLAFVEVETGAATASDIEGDPIVPVTPVRPAATEPGWNLWGDLET